MKYEVKIILEPEFNKNVQGNVLEELVGHILHRQEYKIIRNVHFTGLEIDLLAEHKFKNEILYVECKAKEKPKSTEIKNFIYGVDYGVEDTIVDYGYFIYTEELDRQAGALKVKLEANKKNVSFIGPDQIINLLVGAEIISPVSLTFTNSIVTKTILTYSYFGYYYVYLLQEGVIATHAVVVSARNPNETVSDQIIDKLKSDIKEIKELNVTSYVEKSTEPSKNISPAFETITEVKESEYWYDYSPASIKHFIGRNKMRKSIIDFIENVRMSKTKNRIFYIDGKSGWGKSSLITELRGRSKMKYWRNRMFVVAIDTRSATTSNFVALSFKKIIDDAINSDFIKRSLFFQNIFLTSPFDILSDDSVKELLKELKKKRKVLVIVFDQFEDVFRKEDLFEPFYKFLLDVNDCQENFVVGFSWKSEANIPIGNPAYHLFSQVKDYSLNLKVPEFSLIDVKSVIKQLQRTIGKPIGNELERRLIDASQGFPWLIKKLCIHTYIQYTEGKTIEELIEQDLNIKSLFESDVEKLTKEELVLLKFIAKRSYDENPFDVSDIDDVNESSLEQLVHKRLIIKTGSKYNIYWDIFRDYLVNGNIPVIGENFLIRQSPNACLDLFLIFKDKQSKSLDEMKAHYSIPITIKTLWNILFELRSIGLIRKKEGTDIYELTNSNIDVSKQGFFEYITSKFQNYTPFLELQKIKKQKIQLEDIVMVLKSIFKTSDFREGTWKAYALNLALWIRSSNLELKNRIVSIKKGRLSKIEGDYSSVFYHSPNLLLSIFEKGNTKKTISGRISRDLVLMGFLAQSEPGKYEFFDEKKNADINSEEFLEEFCNEALKFSKVSTAFAFIKSNPRSKALDLLKRHPELVEGFKTTKSKNQMISIIYSWGRFLYNFLELNQVPTNGRQGVVNEGNYFYYSSPKETIKFYNQINAKKSFKDKYEKMKLKMLNAMDIVDFSPSSGTATLKKEVNNEDVFLQSVIAIAKKDFAISMIYNYVKLHGKVSIGDILKNFPEILLKHNTKASRYNRAGRLLVWAKAIHKSESIVK